MGSYLAAWRRRSPSAPRCPTMPLPLAIDLSVAIDLEQTYMRAAADAYLP